MCNREEEEEDAGGTQQGRQQIDQQCHLRWVAGKLREEVGGQHKEGCTRRMANLQLIATG